MSSIGKTILNRVNNGKFVAAAATTYASAVAQSLIQLATSLGKPPADKMTLEEMIIWIGSVLEASGEKLYNSEEALGIELSDDVEPREKRDHAVRKVSDILQSVRNMDPDLPDGALYSLGLSKPVPSTPDLVLAYAEQASKLMSLSTELYTLPSGVVFAPPQTSKLLIPYIEELKTAMAKVVQEDKEHQAVLEQRDMTLDQWNDTYQGIAGIIEGYCRVGGHVALSETVRPTFRKKSGDEGPPPLGTLNSSTQPVNPNGTAP